MRADPSAIDAYAKLLQDAEEAFDKVLQDISPGADISPGSLQGEPRLPGEEDFLDTSERIVRMLLELNRAFVENQRNIVANTRKFREVLQATAVRYRSDEAVAVESMTRIGSQLTGEDGS